MKKILKISVACLASLVALNACKPAVEKEEPASIDHFLFYEFNTGGNEGDKGFIEDDAYIKIINPSKTKTLYLDGLALVQHAFQNKDMKDLTNSGGKDALMNNFAASMVLKFPGTGKDYPVAPGKTVLIAKSARDYTSEDDFWGAAQYSWDLTNADFEYLSEEQMEDKDIYNNPKVPNLEVIYSEELEQKGTETDFFTAQAAFTYALVDLKATKEELTAEENNKYVMHAVWRRVGGYATGGGDGYCMLIPNEWVIDAVTVCPQANYVQSYINPSLDAGFNSVREAFGVEFKNYEGKSIVRRFDGVNYVDTNNSTQDFEKVEATVPHKKAPSIGEESAAE